MTEPIINSVDVSGCEYHIKGKCDIYCSLAYYKENEKCSSNPECDYKQYKRKEQECERLANQYNAVVEQNKQLQTELNILKQYKGSKQASYEAMQKLLNETRLDNRRYKKCLADIKELAKITIEDDNKPACVYDDDCPVNGGVGFDNHCDLTCPFILAKKIVDKINEVESER